MRRKSILRRRRSYSSPGRCSAIVVTRAPAISMPPSLDKGPKKIRHHQHVNRQLVNIACNIDTGNSCNGTSGSLMIKERTSIFGWASNVDFMPWTSLLNRSPVGYSRWSTRESYRGVRCTWQRNHVAHYQLFSQAQKGRRAGTTSIIFFICQLVFRASASGSTQ